MRKIFLAFASVALLLALMASVPALAATHTFSRILMTGNQETPTPVETFGNGIFGAIYDDTTNVLTFTVDWDNLTGPVTAAHFHGPAAEGVGADVRVAITGLPSTSSGTFASTVTLVDSPDETELLGGMWYINLHTTENEVGEIRGQLIEDGLTPLTFSATYDESSGAAHVLAGVGGVEVTTHLFITPICN